MKRDIIIALIAASAVLAYMLLTHPHYSRSDVWEQIQEESVIQ